MTILFKKKLFLTEDANEFIEGYLDYIRDVNPEDIYEGLTDKQILKNKFIFKIYQLENLDSLNVKWVISNNKVSVKANFWNSKSVTLGSINLSQGFRNVSEQDSYPTLKISGGEYKKVVTNEFGEDTIKTYFEPYQLTLELHKADSTVYKSQKIDTLYHSAFKTESSLVKTAKLLMSFFAVFGLVLGLGFMFAGFFLTGLMVIIAFFGVNSYTLLISGSRLTPQHQTIN